ncbi:hypothetical protein [uncultured Pseudokineococcus sp.]|uniref:hypothetical protein n=1 Tax=uncultured Pseudokineococcus sp. TaxID=1642928 RepID=UPI0026145AAC|nr:hypothetical protein [uncultured Pseudokineococcus sp.]
MALVVLTALLAVLLVAAVVGLVRDLRADGYGSAHTSGEGLHWQHRARGDRAFAGPGPR